MFQLAWSYSKPINDVQPNTSEPVLPQICASAFHMWEEHCLECSPPECYQSCRLYIARVDQRCARFKYGISANRHFSGIEGFGAEIAFRRWGKLQTRWVSDPGLYRIDTLRAKVLSLNRTERFVSLTSSVLQSIDPRRRANGAFTLYLSKSFDHWARASGDSPSKPDGFLLVFYSPDDAIGAMFFELVVDGVVRFRRRVPIGFGWNISFFRWEELHTALTADGLARIWLENDQERTLVFTHAHVVSWADPHTASSFLTAVDSGGQPSTVESAAISPAAKVKCVVFDLDNTVWDGVIGDDGLSGVRVRSHMLKLIRDLDARGIICAVASKNDFKVAWSKICELGLQEHLLFPQIHWRPKSESIMAIAEAMNVGIDTLAFIDDNPSERSIVSLAHPSVRVYSDIEALDLLSRDEFDVPITNQSSSRRASYLAESTRIAHQKESGLDMNAFLRSSKLEMRVMSASRHMDRCHELLIRTNQFNLSGKRYSESEFRDLVKLGGCHCWWMADQFGDYGIVGVMRTSSFRDGVAVLDFVMSCRVAGKRAEETLIDSFLRKMMPEAPVFFPVVATGRNRPMIEKLLDLGAVQIEENGHNFLYVLQSKTVIMETPVMKVTIED